MTGTLAESSIFEQHNLRSATVPNTVPLHTATVQTTVVGRKETVAQNAVLEEGLRPTFIEARWPESRLSAELISSHLQRSFGLSPSHGVLFPYLCRVGRSQPSRAWLQGTVSACSRGNLKMSRHERQPTTSAFHRHGGDKGILAPRKRTSQPNPCGRPNRRRIALPKQTAFTGSSSPGHRRGRAGAATDSA